MTPTRIEHTQENTGILGDSEKCAADSDAFSTKNPEIDPDLARVMEAWSTLPDHIRMANLAQVCAAK